MSRLGDLKLLIDGINKWAGRPTKDGAKQLRMLANAVESRTYGHESPPVVASTDRVKKYPEMNMHDLAEDVLDGLNKGIEAMLIPKRVFNLMREMVERFESSAPPIKLTADSNHTKRPEPLPVSSSGEPTIHWWKTLTADQIAKGKDALSKLNLANPDNQKVPTGNVFYEQAIAESKRDRFRTLALEQQFTEVREELQRYKALFDHWMQKPAELNDKLADKKQAHEAKFAETLDTYFSSNAWQKERNDAAPYMEIADLEAKNAKLKLVLMESVSVLNWCTDKFDYVHPRVMDHAQAATDKAVEALGMTISEILNFLENQESDK